jgi:hypothetical protein
MGKVVKAYGAAEKLHAEITYAGRKGESRIDDGGEGIGAIRKNADANEDEQEEEAEDER